MRFLASCILLVIFSISSFVQASTLSVEAYGKLPTKSMLVISPSGNRLAYRDTSNGHDRAVIIDLTNKSLVAAVNITEVKPNSMYFIDEDKLILVASENMKIRGFRGRHNVSAAMVYNLKTKKIHQLLTQGYKIYKGQSQLGRILGISDDKKYAYMPAYANEAQFNLYKTRLDKRAKPRLVQKGTSDTIDFFVGEHGKVIARERFNNKKNLHSIESRIDGEWVNIFNEKTEYRTKSFAGVTPDRKRLVMLSQNESHGRWAYFTLSLADGAVKGPLFSHANKDVETVLTDVNRVVHGVKYSGFIPSYEFFDKKLNARMNGIKKAIPNMSFTITDYTPDWSQIILYMDGKDSSGDYLLYKKGRLDILARARTDIAPDKVNSVVEYRFKARDGVEIPTLLTIPRGKKAKKLPAIMMPHGGPESYDKLAFHYRAQYFASQGYLVIQPQFRGSSGFGSKHLMAGRGEWGRKMQNDLTDAVLDLAKQGKIDKNRVCIVGASYGGYAALAGATFTPDLYKCVVSINGVSDIESMLKTEEREFGDDHWVVAYWQDVIAKGDVDVDHLQHISPINFVKKIKAPVLLIHGEYDKIVPIKQSKEMFEEMEDENKKVMFLELRKGDHHLSSAKNRMKAMIAIDEFVKKHI